MPQPEFQLFDPAQFSELPEQLERSDNPADRFLASFLTPSTPFDQRVYDRWQHVKRDTQHYIPDYVNLQISPEDRLLTIVGATLREAHAKGLQIIAHDSAVPEDPQVILARLMRLWGRNFLTRLLKELRKILCNGKAEHLTNAALAGLIARLAQDFGLPMLTTTGLVFLLLSAITQALRRSFCDTFDRELIEAIAGKKS